MATVATNDLIVEKLSPLFPPETNAGALRQLYRAANSLQEWEDYLAHIGVVQGSGLDVAVAENAFWNAFVP